MPVAPVWWLIVSSLNLRSALVCMINEAVLPVANTLGSRVCPAAPYARYLVTRFSQHPCEVGTVLSFSFFSMWLNWGPERLCLPITRLVGSGVGLKRRQAQLVRKGELLTARPAGAEGHAQWAWGPRETVTLNSEEREYKLGNRAGSRSQEGCTLGSIK